MPEGDEEDVEESLDLDEADGGDLRRPLCDCVVEVGGVIGLSRIDVLHLPEAAPVGDSAVDCVVHRWG